MAVSVARRWFEEVFNGGNFAVAADIVAPGHVLHDPGFPGFADGPEGMRQLAEAWRRSFPDARMTIEDEITMGDKVVLRWTVNGTYRGESFAGTVPTKTSVTVAGITATRVYGGLMQETWNFLDARSLLDQVRYPASLEESWIWPPWWW